MNRRISVWIVALVWCISAMAQQALFGGNEIVSPEINQDGTVTFRLFAPNASQVQVTGDFLPNIKVQSPFGEIEQPQIVDLKQVDGVWTYTTPTALTPELYSYKFKVDGLDYLDPSNVYMCRDIASYTNIFIVSKDKGDTGYWYSVNDVPHGNVSKVWYESPTLKMNRRMTVYTPPGYEKGGKYPTLYLLHGAGGDEEAWPSLGRAAQIFDNLIADEKIEPMVVVMTNGNPNSEAAPGEGSKGMYKPSFMGHMNPAPIASMEDSFMDVVNYVEKNYNVYTDKQHRAISGLSMGGGHSFSISKQYPELFDYVGLFSAAVSLKNNFRLEETANPQSEADPVVAEQLKVLFEGNPKLYWIAIGNTDFLYPANETYRNYLDSKGYNYEYVETDGGHIWRNWRIYLTDFSQKLFK